MSWRISFSVRTLHSISPPFLPITPLWTFVCTLSWKTIWWFLCSSYQFLYPLILSLTYMLKYPHTCNERRMPGTQCLLTGVCLWSSNSRFFSRAHLDPALNGSSLNRSFTEGTQMAGSLVKFSDILFKLASIICVWFRLIVWDRLYKQRNNGHAYRVKKQTTKGKQHICRTIQLFSENNVVHSVARSYNIVVSHLQYNDRDRQR